LALNWVRIAWTLAFAVLGLLAFFVYIDYSNQARQREAEIEAALGMKAGPGAGKPTAKAATTRPLPRRSRKYRMKR